MIYQIYPQSFKDHNGDGIGDLPGILEKLDYLEAMGIDVIWIGPIFQSPLIDNGYDISDYYRVNPIYGTDEDLDQLIEEAGRRGIKIILDLVINHCSDQHAWFQMALQEPDSEEAGYFYFMKTDSGEAPNNWRSNFGGPAWTQTADGRWYLHTFSKEQPDLNWENPKLRRKLYDMINWWLDKGIGGFRVDAITFIKKDTTFASRETEEGRLYPIENYQNYPGIGTFLTELKQATFQKFNCLTVGEAPGVPPEKFGDYAGEDGYFSMIFDFSWEHMRGVEIKGAPEAVSAWRDKIFKSQMQIQQAGWSANFLESHDHPRSPNKFLDKQNRSRESITTLATLYFFLRGTPLIYQGQELGMTNTVRNSIREFKDVSAHNFWKEGLALGKSDAEMLKELNDIGRDNGRSPFQWNRMEHAGFTSGTPWMPVHSDYQTVNAEEAQADDNSILAYYKKMIKLRKNSDWSDVLCFGSFNPILEQYPSLIAYRRSYKGRTLTIVCNMSSESVKLPVQVETCLLTNQSDLHLEGENLILNPYQSMVLEESSL
ncbi:alpha-amylase [Paenibacillus physcomitrellae]|uniref:Alpha-amylase n=1 Tax=Paenibacillus physcomitrellae TaxID=1619311 RepID=A0ABQ1GRE6_9BACL|nr:alpha-amylase [Paenibacillus physcomitrellae]